ncbi:MAG TPA: histidine kinase, partial [Porphyromonadaceae bacterium]|nr:histidine kinase [Porphyromonadaceae bacterium]
MMDDVWRQAMMLEMNIEASNYDNIRIVIADAKESNETQIKQIQQFIDQKVDVLIISPNQSDSITPIAVEAYRKGIPTIIVDRKIGSEEYTTYVGGDSYEIGRIAGEYASAFLPENATIAEVWGTKLSSPAQERHLGFINGLKKKNVN